MKGESESWSRMLIVTQSEYLKGVGVKWVLHGVLLELEVCGVQV